MIFTGAFSIFALDFRDKPKHALTAGNLQEWSCQWFSRCCAFGTTTAGNAMRGRIPPKSGPTIICNKFGAYRAIAALNGLLEDVHKESTSVIRPLSNLFWACLVNLSCMIQTLFESPWPVRALFPKHAMSLTIALCSCLHSSIHSD